MVNQPVAGALMDPVSACAKRLNISSGKEIVMELETRLSILLVMSSFVFLTALVLGII